MFHGYDGGRPDLPFVGLCTFGKSPRLVRVAA